MEKKNTKSNFESSDEDIIENRLRPKKLSDYIGQNKVKDSMSVFIRAAKLRNEPLEHILIYGPPGLGKTTLAYILANETETNIKITSGPAIERAGDLVSILTNLEDADILFIDEIHRLNKVVEEILYPAMEEYAIDVVIGKGPSAKILRVDLPHFTLIGATTRVSMISSPMRDRFGIIHCLDFYNENEIAQILSRSSKILDLTANPESIKEIAKRSRKTPRIANRLLKRVRDFATVYNKGVIDKKVTDDSLLRLGIDKKGLDEVDRKYLKTLLEKFAGGPVGVETISAASSIEKDTIEEVIEPYLMQIAFIKRTPKGRVATDQAREYFGFLKQKPN
ncbi:MAG: Holliday junction branch migration DNA helicase RuvB [Candidatus Berkelbacteria bacterium]|nr:Holliday junction branch migration DNA helicase RuvB [Candidatus Berkelbacteria bacterium]